ncbi:hypothetical protein CRUP_013047 [Coryphaenoides rupestris]|nr:hypothetical protein CRUP_013047 [Coryphaenoides rupestris]
MDEIRPLLEDRPPEGAEGPHLNLRPRHQELIPTPCGPIKRWSELSVAVQLYFCFTLTSLCVLLALTVASLCGQNTGILEEDFTISIIQLVGICECPTLRRFHSKELGAFLLSVVIVGVRSVVNYIFLSQQEHKHLMVRFVCILCLGGVHIVCTCLLIRMPDRMAFRVGGALESVQERYFLLNLCFSMVTFDLQAQLCLCILLTGNTTRFGDNVLLACALFWACLTAALLKEARVLLLVFVLQNIPEMAFFIYLMYTIISRWVGDSTGPHTLEAASVVGALVSVGIKMALLWPSGVSSNTSGQA